MLFRVFSIHHAEYSAKKQLIAMGSLVKYIGLALFLSACATPQQRAEFMERDFGPQGRKQGYAPGTETYRRCLQALHNVEISDDLLRAMNPHF